ncbi:hypothetical protein SLEP1_g55934 [Rubroshorea leprosula]|uniref:Uncharacterized protein n=1 Tax=Rubroshorea leprosula TaxID=152421 RepID=A0AAV5MH24_9ROSI|nr:hypothetical protein SLEP1_g55934 [Rubroshorea leprosula]
MWACYLLPFTVLLSEQLKELMPEVDAYPKDVGCKIAIVSPVRG